MKAHEIDYTIYGEEMQFVEIGLDPGEAVVAEAGSFMMMDEQIRMDTIFGDGSGQSEDILGSLFSAGKRLLTGESLFMTVFTNVAQDKRKVSFASPYPGKILPVELRNYGGEFICQKDAFLCAAKGVAISIEFSKRLGRGFFGGEGFIMEKIQGDGLAFLHASGTVFQRELKAGESVKVDTGCIVAFSSSVQYDIEFIGGIRNTIFGGEGIFFATLTGPGTIAVQSLPFSRLADRIIAHAPRAGGRRKGEGSILGDLGDLLDGDNR